MSIHCKHMKRRNFLKIAGASSFVVNGHAMRPFSNSKIGRIMADCEDVEDRVLVLIQLKGGNDGVNTIVPKLRSTSTSDGETGTSSKASIRQIQ